MRNDCSLSKPSQFGGKLNPQMIEICGVVHQSYPQLIRHNETDKENRYESRLPWHELSVPTNEGNDVSRFH